MTVYAGQGSAMEGVKIVDLGMPPHELDPAYNHENWVSDVHIAYRVTYISELIKDSANFDIIHFHVGRVVFGEPFLKFAKCPVVFTIHENLEKPFERIMNFYQHANLVSISASQRKAMPDLNYVETIYHGLELKDFIFGKKPTNGFLFLSRVSKEKGVEFAIEAANQAHQKLDIYGPGDTAYLEEAVLPKVNDDIKYHGLVEKYSEAWYAAFREAKAIIIPIQWEEPFGLVMIEAMAGGTPVIAFNRGSVPEIVIDGVTGIVCPPNDIDALARAMTTIQNMSDVDYLQMRENCRKHVEKNFTVQKVGDRYESLYNRLIGASRGQ